MTLVPDLSYLALGRAIRKLREARGWSIEQVAARAEMETAMVHAIEAGEIEARWSTVMMLLNALGATLSDLASEMD
jgi:transcriptional regulator with XRE-family HTH domain